MDEGSGQKYIVFKKEPGGQSIKMQLDEFVDDARPDLRIDVKLALGPVSLAATYRRAPLKGCHRQWNMLQLFKALHMEAQKGDVGRWASHGWEAWEKHLRMAGLSEHHLVKKCLRHLGDEHVGMPLASANLVEARACTSHGLLALVSKWAADGKVGLRHSGDKEKLRVLLAAMVEAPFRDGECAQRTCTVFLEAAVWEPPLCPTGRKPLHVHVQQGRLNLRSLAVVPDCRARAVLSLLRPAAGYEDSIPLRVALPILAADSYNEATGWLYKQLVWCVGFWVDDFYKDRLRSAFVMPLSAQSHTAGDTGLFKYWFAMRGAFRDAGCLHIALDGSTLLKRSVVAGVCVLPNGTGAIFPPQATSG